VKAWGELQKDDYDFRNWAKDASKQLLQAGSVYEYVSTPERSLILQEK
jgi:hypothetical protein